MEENGDFWRWLKVMTFFSDHMDFGTLTQMESENFFKNLFVFSLILERIWW